MSELRCILCGGNHIAGDPNLSQCLENDEGIDREVARMGCRRWNRISAHVSTQYNRRQMGGLSLKEWLAL